MQHRSVRRAALRPGQRGRPRHRGRGRDRRDRPERRALLPHRRHLALRGDRAATRETARRPPAAGSARPPRIGEQAGRRKFAGRPRAMPEPPVTSGMSAHASPMAMRSLVGDRRRPRRSPQPSAAAPKRARTLRHPEPRWRAWTRPTLPVTGAGARAPGWRRSSASADGGACRNRTAARRRRTDGPCRWCGRCRGRPGRRW